MLIKRVFLVIALATMALVSGCQKALVNEDTQSERIEKILTGDHRTEASKARDGDRRPAGTLVFWGVEPDMTVVEIWPGGGWYTEILAPLLRDEGLLVAGNFPQTARPKWRANIGRDYVRKLESLPEVYGRVKVVAFDPPEHPSLGAPESADMVILSRHFHNFIRAGIVDDVLSASWDVLKPGGTLAVVQHRARPDATPEWEERTGYVREAWLTETVEAAGFRLDAKSPLNHNPADTREHDDGVWSLPPSLRTCRRISDEVDRESCIKNYMAVGESDRMTLRFIKK